jgi:hypothetical protein
MMGPGCDISAHPVQLNVRIWNMNADKGDRFTVELLIERLKLFDPKLEVVMDTRWKQGGELNRIREPVISLCLDGGPGGGPETVLMLRNMDVAEIEEHENA